MKTIIIFFCCLFSISTSLAQNLKSKLPEVTLYNTKHDSLSLHQLSKNKVVLIDFWFVPCGPCFLEMPMLHKIYQQYQNNPEFEFITICITDSVFIKPFLEGKDTKNNYTYSYYKTTSGLNEFKLPVYFMKNVSDNVVSIKKVNSLYSSHSNPQKKDVKAYPEYIFGFKGYPTLLIFDKTGSLIFHQTGFERSSEQKELNQILNLLKINLGS